MARLAEEEIDRSDANRWLRIAGGVVLILAAGTVAVYLLKGLSGGGKAPNKQVAKITVLPDTPPPPPPPPKDEPKPPKESKEVKVEQPRPVDMPQAEPLKMEGQAGEGASPFAAGTVSRDYIGGAVGGRMQFAWFANALQKHIQEELARNRKLKSTDYRVMVNVWIGADGAIHRAELAGSTGDAGTDGALRAALTELGPMKSSVPDNLPQPIKLRITNRMTG